MEPDVLGENPQGAGASASCGGFPIGQTLTGNYRVGQPLHVVTTDPGDGQTCPNFYVVVGLFISGDADRVCLVRQFRNEGNPSQITGGAVLFARTSCVFADQNAAHDRCQELTRKAQELVLQLRDVGKGL